MYPSPDARSREIEAGAAWPVGRLVRYSWIVEPSGASVPDTNQYPKRFQISGAILSISRFPTHSG
jgi:hypothetical protein